ncbi:MAG: PEP-CTERM sorting domain-containing protein [Phycisphaerales bacterium]|nr:PEP-CTERM sorting domain-containing protein [Phycisphaerales bacterium]
MTLLTVTSPSKLSGGQIDFYDNLNNPILQIVFDAADLYAPYVFAASKFEGQNVSFSGPAITFPVFDEEMFSFSFANQVVTPNGRTWTAAFTSSAVIPEPGTLALLVFGTLAMIRRPRN